ncbi:hypothetical protein JKA74_17705 [Marivirga sp. S37H4]|uniref:Uncharacterized protein n=1 Tax=Marivirga aurantiaca TaxID=2802615 RepID=A0A934X0V5_9BACT|nr:hypothetical protein [Marivirga aurantiaca]MBK6266883.1 hypothetical protein [Marivirga aurantiaca]
MELKKLIKISNFIYLLTLVVIIPLYLVIYAASGHRFNFTNEDIFWISIVSGAILTFFINRIRNNFISRLFVGILATIILFGATQIAWSQLNFKFGDDGGLVVVILLTVWPIIFLIANVLFIYSLFLRPPLNS